MLIRVNWTQSPKINPHITGQTIFNRDTKTPLNGTMTVSSTSGIGKNEYPYAKEENGNLILYNIQK